MKLVYDRRYNIGFLGLERFHPFDSRKYGRAWKAVGREVRRLRDRAWVGVPRPASDADLAAVHDPAYLLTLRDPTVLAVALELPFVRRLPSWAVRWAILRPMRWAVAGSLVAAREALACGLAVNLSGGYHHAKPARGEGFCVFNDIAYLVHRLRAEGRLGPTTGWYTSTSTRTRATASATTSGPTRRCSSTTPSTPAFTRPTTARPAPGSTARSRC
ncbi:MAG TPA: hypothetical protein VD866_01220 [Urbifossiella sp.]|nr:hypothetical protein [Urbifossiella sp.]